MQRRGNLLQRQPDALRRADECETTQRGPLVTALVPRGAHRGDQAQVLVIAEGRLGESGARRQLADGEQICSVQHDDQLSSHYLNLTLGWGLRSTPADFSDLVVIGAFACFGSPED